MAAGATLVAALAFGALVFAAGIPARPGADEAVRPAQRAGFPRSWSPKGNDVASIDQATAETIARNVLADLRAESAALQRKDQKLAATAASGTWLASLWSQMRAPSSRTTVAQYDVERMVMSLKRGTYQGPPTVVANLQGTLVASTYGRGPTFVSREDPQRFRRTVELALENGRYLIIRSEGGLARNATGCRGTERHARRHVVRERRTPGRARLPPGCVPLREVPGHDGDDGRRALLAGLRLGRLARPLRRQLARGRRHRSRGFPRRPPPIRAVPQRGRTVRRTCRRAPAPTSPFAETVAWRPTSTWTVAPIST